MAIDPKNFPTRSEIQRLTQEARWHRLYRAEPYPFIEYSKGNRSEDLQLDDLMNTRLKEFFANDRVKAQILDRALNAGRKVVDAGTTYMFRGGFRVLAGEPDQDNQAIQAIVDDIIERNDLADIVPESSKLYQAVGHSHFKVWKEDGKARVVEIPFDYWLPNWEGVLLGQQPNNVRLSIPLEKIGDLGVTSKYVYIEDYEIRERSAICTKRLYQAGVQWKVGGEVDLAIAGLKDSEGKPLTGLSVVEPWPLDVLPFVTINRPKTIKDRFAQSIFEPVQSQLQEINDRLTQVSLQFLKHLNAKLEIPETAVQRNDDGSVSMRSVEVILTKPGDQPSRYVTNDNPLIEAAFTHIDRCLTHIAKFTQTPEDFLTGSERAVERVEAMRIRMDDFIARIEQDRSLYATGIKKLTRLCLKIQGVKEADTVPLTVEYNDPLPRDMEVDMRIWSEAKNTGLASTETAVRNFQRLKGDALQDELSKIGEEEQARTMSNLANAFGGMQPPGDQEPPQV